MYKIKTMNKIAQCGLDLFDKAFTCSDTEAVSYTHLDVYKRQGRIV